VQDETHYFATAVIEKGDGRLKVATLSWLKEPSGSWLAKALNKVTTPMGASTGDYTLPTIQEGAGLVESCYLLNEH
jgi:hypothetical protein